MVKFQASGKKSVSFEKSVSFSDDPPPLPSSILLKRGGAGWGDGGRSEGAGRGDGGRRGDGVRRGAEAIARGGSLKINPARPEPNIRKGNHH